MGHKVVQVLLTGACTGLAGDPWQLWARVRGPGGYVGVARWLLWAQRNGRPEIGVSRPLSREQQEKPDLWEREVTQAPQGPPESRD